VRLSRSLGFLRAALVVVSAGTVAGSPQQGPPPPPTGTSLIAGQVVDASSRRPIDAATVSLIPRAGSAFLASPLASPVVVDSQGRFFFGSLPAGSYSLQVVKPGYSAAAIANLSRVVEVAAGERVTDVRIRLVKLASLGGTVRDDSGDPVVGTGVIAFRRTQVNGRAILRPVGQGRTDDRGVYRIANLQPGDYIVCACTRDPIPIDGVLLTTLASEPLQLMSLAARAVKAGADTAALDNTLRTFAPMFYPNSPVVARATRVKVGPGDEKTGIDVDVAAVRATRVSGAVVGATSPLLSTALRLVPAGESEEGASVAQLPPMLVQPDGRFDFAGVPPGQYVLQVAHVNTTQRGGGAPSGAALAFLGARGVGMGASSAPQAPTDALVWAAEPVTVGEAGVSGLTIQLRAGARINGRIRFEGNAAVPASQVLGRSGVLVRQLSPDPQGSLTSGGLGRINSDLTFQVPSVVPGRYGIATTGLPGWPTLKSITLGGQDVTDLPIEIDTADVSDLELTLTDTPMPTLDGALPAGRAAEDLSLLVFPADRRFWTDPAAAARRFRSGAISRAGAVTIALLPAGEYFLAVVPDEAAAEWQEPSQLETLARTAQRVRLADGEKKTVELKR
jgi:hypothetical protein